MSDNNSLHLELKMSIEELYAEQLSGQANWKTLSNKIELTEEILSEFKDCIDWRMVFYNPSLTIEMIDKYLDYLLCDAFYYKMFFKFKEFPEWFLKKHKYKLDWNLLYENDLVPEDFNLEF